MKTYTFICLLAALNILSLQAFSQDKGKPKNEAPKEDTTPLLGLAGDNLDLYAVLDIFQKSKTIEAFEKSLNDPETKVNNLDLNLDKKVDFIKVVTNKKDNSYQFVLRVDVSKTESQDVAVILLDKDKDKKISLQIVGDEELYGKDYVIEPKGNSSVTPNPAYKGEDPITVNVQPSTTTVQVVQQAPIVQYVYSPAYVPYVPPYYYGFYPAWFGFATVMAVGIYRHNNWYHHGGYYGGHYGGGHNNVIINTGNRNNFNNYNNNKMRSNTVSNNMARGSYGNGAGARNREASMSNRQSAGVSNNMRGPSTSNRQSSPSVSNRQSSPSMSNRQTPSASTRHSSSGLGSSSNRSSGSSFGGGGSYGGGGGRSMGGGGRSMGSGGGRSMGGGRRG